MNRSGLAKALAEKTNLNRKTAEKLIIAFGDVVSDTVSRGDKIVYSNFGNFYRVHYPSKVIYHPKFGAEKKMVMLPTNVCKWMPAINVKEAILKESPGELITMHGSKRKNLAAPPTDETVWNKPGSFPVEKVEEKSEYKESTPPAQSDEVEIPIHKNISPAPLRTSEEKTDKEPISKENIGIYEETTKDGGKEEATFNGTINLHERKSFLSRLFGHDKDKEEEKPAEDSYAPEAKDKDEKVSLVDSGIFGKGDDLPQKPANPVEPEVPTKLEVPPSTQQPEASAKITPLPSNDQKAPTFQLPHRFSAGFGSKKEADMEPFTKQKVEDIFYADLSKTVVPKEVLQKIPEKLARKYKLVPVEEKDDEFVIAMVDPEDIEAKDLIKKYIQKKIVVRLATEDDINRILDQYNGLETEVKEAIKIASMEEPEKTSFDKSTLVESASENAPAARIVNSILRRAIRDKSSDIHIEPSEKQVDVRFRIDGILSKKVILPKNLQSAAISRIKILSNMKIDEQRLPQDGRFSITMDNRKIDFRVSTMPVAYGEKVVMRILDKMTGILSIEKLGIRGRALLTLQNNLKKTHGMTLVTGPTGSGKTTTLYALIDQLYDEGVNIVTLEDPIEYQMPGINQSQVNAEINYSFASGLRSIVRQDPDIIMIGEVRDGETADMAVHAALTGHIVLSTLHTNDAAGAAPRLIDMNIEPFLLNSSLNIVIGQRLARKLCDECKEETKLPPEEMQKIEIEVNKMPEKERTEIKSKPPKFYTAKGCDSCVKTGYKGRVGVYEVLEMTEKIKELVLKKTSSSIIQAEAIKEGMVTMLQDGVTKALDGITSVEEVWRSTRE